MRPPPELGPMLRQVNPFDGVALGCGAGLATGSAARITPCVAHRAARNTASSKTTRAPCAGTDENIRLTYAPKAETLRDRAAVRARRCLESITSRRPAQTDDRAARRS